MVRRRVRTGLELALSTAAASIEAQQVIALRLAKLARGGRAAALEAQRMVDEKVKAAATVSRSAGRSYLLGASAGVPARAVATYRRAVRANRRRLLKELV